MKLPRLILILFLIFNPWSIVSAQVLVTNAKTNNYTVVVTSGDQSTVLVTKLTSGASQLHPIEVGFRTITEATELADGRILVIGIVQSSMFQVLIIDFADNSIDDSFFCYVPSLSPDKRKLAFVRYYPPRGMSNIQDVYKIYNLNRTPADNRSADSKYNTDTNVGSTIIFSNNDTNENIGADVVSPHRIASQGFYWESSNLLFSDLHLGKLFIVVVDTEAADNYYVTLLPINSALCSDDCEGVLVNRISFSNSTVSALLKSTSKPGLSDNILIPLSQP